MSEEPPVLIVVALAMISPEGRVLVQQRSPEKAHGGLWEFPGGKLEAGEAPEAALVREIREELGVDVATTDLAPLSFASNAPAYGQRMVLLLLYTTKRWRGSPVAQEAGTHVDWVAVADLPALPMPPLDIPLAQALISMIAEPVIEGVAKGKRPT